MIQLKVYQSEASTDAEAIFLDLYETQPIKLTLSVEDITTADATSVFSRTFKVPATRHNNEFFQNAFELDGIDFDITIKKPAQILVDGSEFKVGHVRLQKIYANGDLDKIDYELLFLGETRDFSSIIGEKPLCQLVMTDFDWDDNPVEYTNAADFIGPFNYNDVVGSWNAYPENASLTAGTADGDLLFPLIDHGNTYDDAGNPEQGMIKIAGSDRFTQSSNSLSLDRLKPMIRAKRVWDQIFEDSGYTYTSTFLNSDLFHQMYISAFGNEEKVGADVGQITTTIFESSNPTNGENDVQAYMFNDNVTSNVGGYYNVGSSDVGPGGTGSYFISPGTATIAGNYYIMEISAQVDAQLENSDGTFTSIPSAVQLCVVSSIGGTITQTIATGNFTYNMNTSILNYDSRNGGYQIQAGDILQVFITPSGTYDLSMVDNTYWDCTAAPGDYYAPADLSCEYRQIDFIKDVLTMFRLVLQPDKNKPNNFIIEPWQEFIGSGTTYDWSNKLVREKDFVSEPLFNTQSAEIEYTMQEDEDLINAFHQDNTKHAYGWLRFNSGNELLKGTRDVEVLGISPTPIDQINHGTNAPHPYPQWILPTIIEVTGENFDRLPIVTNTRFLFYNGEQNIAVAQDDWYLDNDTGNPVLQTTWPLVSPYENWPVTQTSLNLNFFNDTRYYINPDPGTGYYDQGSTLFDEYWSRYISSIYNKFSRRVTAYFTLNNVDLQDLTFDDLIFIDGKYYRPEKIVDAQIGERTAVKVQLITYKDKRPVWLDEPLTGFSVVVSDGDCFGDPGSVQVTTNGTPQFDWEIAAIGLSGTYNAPAGNAPYIFDINNVPIGTHELVVTDSLGRDATVTVSISPSSSTPVTATWVVTDATVCTNPGCNGEVVVTPAGGQGPYTITWIDGQPGFTRTNLCSLDYQFYITDSVGCQSDVYTAEISCVQPPIFKYDAREHLNSCTQLSAQSYIIESPFQLPLQQTLTLNEIPGCFQIIAESTNTPSYTVDALSVDCAQCSGTSFNSWQIDSCDTPTISSFLDNPTTALAPGDVVTTNETGSQCWEIISQSIAAPTKTMNNKYNNCTECEVANSFQYYASFCDGSTAPLHFNSGTTLAVGSVVKVLDGIYANKCVTIIVENPGATTFGNLNTFAVYNDCVDCEYQPGDRTYVTLQECDTNPIVPAAILAASTTLIPTTFQVGDFVTLQCRPGCWEIITKETTGPGVQWFDLIDTIYDTCTDCNTAEGAVTYWEVERCASLPGGGTTDVIKAYSGQTPVVGDFVRYLLPNNYAGEVTGTSATVAVRTSVMQIVTGCSDPVIGTNPCGTNPT